MISRGTQDGLRRQSTTDGVPTKQKTGHRLLAWRAAMFYSVMPGHLMIGLCDRHVGLGDNPKALCLDSTVIIPPLSPKRKRAFSALRRSGRNVHVGFRTEVLRLRTLLPRWVRRFRKEVSRGIGLWKCHADKIRRASGPVAAASKGPVRERRPHCQVPGQVGRQCRCAHWRANAMR